MMRNLRSLALGAALAAGSVFAVGCTGTVEQAPPQTSASAATKAPIGTTTHGLVKVMGEALGEVALRPEQRTEIERLAQEADARHLAMHQARKELMLAVADQVEAGAVDRAALAPKLERVRADFEASRPADAAALERLHAILDADQRNAFVFALEGRMRAMRADHAGHGARKGHKKGLGHFHQLAEQLELTDEQRTQIREALMAQKGELFGGSHEKRAHGDREARERRGPRGDRAMKGHRGEKVGHGGHRGHHGMMRGLEAFRSDQFDASALSQGHAGHAMKAMKDGGPFLKMAESIVPILTPEQRKVAAEKLRDLESKGGMPFAQ
jgi:Spy/CpxP family protein refolding chaperone